MSTERDELVQRGEAARDRLLQRVQLLEHRKRAVLGAVRTVGRWAAPLAAGVAAAMALTGVAVVAAVRVGQRRKRRRALLRGWSDAVGLRHPTRPSLANELRNQVLMTAVNITAARLLRWGLYRALPLPAEVEPTNAGAAMTLPSASFQTAGAK